MTSYLNLKSCKILQELLYEDTKSTYWVEVLEHDITMPNGSVIHVDYIAPQVLSFHPNEHFNIVHCKAVTLIDAMMFIYEKHRYWLEVEATYEKFKFTIFDAKTKIRFDSKFTYSLKEFETPNEAAEEGLKILLKMIAI